MFGGFTDKDFDAYAPQKRKSNVFNRERLEVKQKLVALGREVAGGLNSTDGAPLLCEASVEHPALWNHKQVDAQHLFFSRNEGARKELDRIIDRARPMTTMLEDPSPQRNHVFLSITIDYERVEFALKLHPHARVDRQNLERKLGEHWEREKLVALLRSLPGGYHLGVTGGTTVASTDASEETLRQALLELARPELPGHTHWLVVERSLPRAEAAAAGAEILAAARRELFALLPIYHFIAWTRDNDFVSMREMLKQEKREKAQRGLARNDRVRIVRGMFAGRQGVVQEIDAKGSLRVQVGKVAVKLGADDDERSP
jgi:transcription antitermination factor NusG